MRTSPHPRPRRRDRHPDRAGRDRGCVHRLRQRQRRGRTVRHRARHRNRRGGAGCGGDAVRGAVGVLSGGAGAVRGRRPRAHRRRRVRCPGSVTLRRGRRWRRFSSRSASGSPRTGSGPRSPRPGSRPGPNATPTRWPGSGSRSPPRSSRREAPGCWGTGSAATPRTGGADDLHRIPRRLPRRDRRDGGVESVRTGGCCCPRPIARAGSGRWTRSRPRRTGSSRCRRHHEPHDHAPHPAPDHDPAPESRSSRRTVTLVVSVVFLLILVAGGTVALLASRSDSGDTTTGATGLPSTSPAAAAPRNRTGPGGAPPTSTRSGGAWRHPRPERCRPRPGPRPAAARSPTRRGAPRRGPTAGRGDVLHRARRTG